MSDIQKYLLEVGRDRDAARLIAQKTAKALDSKDVQLLTIVESIGEHLNNEDGILRGNSVLYLADVIDSVSSGTLNAQQRDLLVNFLLSRLEDDPEAVSACIQALISLERCQNFDDDTARKTAKALIGSTHPLNRYKLQAERFIILQFLDILVAKYRRALTELANNDEESLTKFVSHFESEKDPRNLMIVFSIVLVPMNEWNLGDNAQELFDFVFNYFPITFRPPPGDPFKITAQDLKDRLKMCISSTSAFAPFAFPALLDKLDSTSLNTKRDVLQALLSCVEAYDFRSYQMFIITIWEALRIEINNNQETDIIDLCMDVLSTIAKQTSLLSPDALGTFLKPVIKDANEACEDAPTKQSDTASQVLCRLGSTSFTTADYIVKGVLPTLLSLFQATNSIPKRRGLVQVLNRILESLYISSKSWQVRDENGIIIADHVSDHALLPFVPEILKILLEAVIHSPQHEVSFHENSLQGLQHLLQIRKALSDDDCSDIMQACVSIVTLSSTVERDPVRCSAVNVIVSATEYHSGVVIEKVVPALMSRLPDSIESGNNSHEPALEMLAKLGNNSRVTEVIILRLKNKIDAVRRQGADKSYVFALLAAILYIFTYGKPATDGKTIRFEYFEDLLLPWLLQAIDMKSSSTEILCQEKSVELLARISSIILHDQTTHKQVQAMAKFNAMFQTLKQPLSSQSVKSRLGLSVLVSLHVHAAVNFEIYGEDYPVDLLKALLRLAREIDISQVGRMAILQHISLIINKFIPAAKMQDICMELDLLAMQSSETLKKGDVEILASIVKGIIMTGKNFAITDQLLNSLLLQLDSDAHGTIVALSIGRLVSDDGIITRENGCKISGLYKQRTYTICYKSIENGVRNAGPDKKTNYLLALSTLIRNLPYDVMKQSSSSITVLLLQGLDVTGPRVAEIEASCLKTLEAMIVYDPETISEHSTTLINRLINKSIAHDKQLYNAEVQVDALKCLKFLASQLKRAQAIQHRQLVITRLRGCLDDEKRSVRAEAVRCRTAWIDLDNDEEADG